MRSMQVRSRRPEGSNPNLPATAIFRLVPHPRKPNHAIITDTINVASKPTTTFLLARVQTKARVLIPDLANRCAEDRSFVVIAV